MKKRKLRPFIPIIILLLAAFAVYVLWANTALGVTEISIMSSDLPESFDGFCIVQISDLHSAEFGKDNVKLMSKIQALEPNMIVLTGDIYDDRFGEYSVPLNAAKKAAEIAPTYFVSGNHDVASQDFDFFLSELKSAGVNVLSNETVSFEKNGEVIYIAGISDPMELKAQGGTYAERTAFALDKAASESDGFTVLLAHRPEHIGTYSSYGYDLVFSGHAHGGQFRLPFIGGLYAPNQGVFPKYDAGLYNVDGTQLIVSRGLGNSSFPVRLFNDPEIVAVRLIYSEDQNEK